MGEIIVNGFLFMLSTVYLVFAKKLSFGTITYPKAGFVPQVVGWMAVLVSGYLLVQSVMGKGDAKDVKLEIDWPRLGLLAVVMALYIVILKPLGYIISSFLLLFAVLLIAKVEGWKLPAAISLCASAGFYFVFKILLSVPLPKGLIG